MQRLEGSRRKLGWLGWVLTLGLFVFAPVAHAIDSGSLLNSTNQQRAASRVAPLALNNQLNQAAAAKLADMATKHYWDHISPTGETFSDFISAAGYPWVRTEENLAEGFATSSTVITAWMNSPGHHDNMMSAYVRDVGFASGMVTWNNQTAIVTVAEYGSTVQGATALLPPSPNPATATKPTTAKSGNSNSVVPTPAKQPGSSTVLAASSPPIIIPATLSPRKIFDSRAAPAVRESDWLLALASALAAAIFTIAMIRHHDL